MRTVLHVGLLSPEYPPRIFGGLGTHVGRVVGALAGPVAFDLLLPEGGNYSQPGPAIAIHEVPVGEAANNVDFWLRFSRNAARAARELSPPPDLIHCHDWMTVLAGISLKAALRVPLVYNIHLPQGSEPTLSLENLGLAHADLVLVNSRAVRREIAARNLPTARVAVVPNGVDLNVFRLAPDWPADAGYVLFVGRLVPQKGVDRLLRAFGVVLRRCPEARLVVVGDGDLQLYLQRVAHHLGFPHKVSFIDWQSGPALVELYQGARVVAVPSYYEPFGIVALEAMACGRPVVASRVGGLAEFIQDGVQGYLVPVGDHLRLAQRLTCLLLDADLRQRMGQSAREQAARFSWERAGRATLALYRGLAGRPPRSAPADTRAELGAALLENLDPELQALAAGLLNEAEPFI